MCSKEKVTAVFKEAGITIGGASAWDIVVHDDRFYNRIIADGSLGLGESYMEGWWDCERIDLCIEKLLRADIRPPLSFNLIFLWLRAKLFNLQSLSGAREVIDAHYDLSNELYMSFLDPYNQYTCGYFKDTEDLDIAQIQKMDLICKKLQLKTGDRVLDIGCGWGGFAKYASETYGCHVTGLTLSKEQAKYAREFTKNLPVDIQIADYRLWLQKNIVYDKIVVVGMIEHVGYKNYRTFFEIVEKMLKKDGVFLLHTIGHNLTKTHGEAWSDKYIFPNGMCPSPVHIGKSAEGLFVIEDWHNFGAYYAKTLEAWNSNFETNWSKISHKYSNTFFRMFHYYFMSFAGGFRARELNLWQIVFTKGDTPEVYKSVR